MTEYYKENFYDEYSIKKGDIIIAIVDSGSNANKICDLLNELHEEKEQLKSNNKQYEILVKSLKDENQKLRLRLKDLGVEYY